MPSLDMATGLLLASWGMLAYNNARIDREKAQDTGLEPIYLVVPGTIGAVFIASSIVGYRRAGRCYEVKDAAARAAATANARAIAQHARELAATSSCPRALALGAEVAALDPAVYQEHVVGDPAIASCTGAPAIEREASRHAPARGRAAPSPIAYVSGGVALSWNAGGEDERGQASLHPVVGGALRIPHLPLWARVHGQLGRAHSDTSTTPATFLRVGGGLELRTCGDNACVFGGIALSYYRQYEVKQTYDGPVIAPRIGFEWGAGYSSTSRSRPRAISDTRTSWTGGAPDPSSGPRASA